MFKDNTKKREEKLELFSHFIFQFNQHLQQAKRKRSKEAIAGSIKKELARFFEKPVFSKIKLAHTFPNGSTKRIISYQVAIKYKNSSLCPIRACEALCRGEGVYNFRVYTVYRMAHMSGYLVTTAGTDNNGYRKCTDRKNSTPAGHRKVRGQDKDMICTLTLSLSGESRKKI